MLELLVKVNIKFIFWQELIKHNVNDKISKFDNSVVTLDSDEDSRASNNIIEIKDTDSWSSCSKAFREFDQMFKETPMLAMFIEKCVNLDPSDTMMQVLEENLLKLYKTMDQKLKKSEDFKKVLTKSLYNLNTYPDLKFTHVRQLCDQIRFKKRVKLTTLATDLKSEYRGLFILI